MKRGAAWLVRHCRAACLLLPAVLSVAGAVTPTAELPPAPAAHAVVVVRYPPVPIAGSTWEKTVRKREAAARRAQQRAAACQAAQGKGKRPAGCGKPPAGPKRTPALP